MSSQQTVEKNDPLSSAGLTTETQSNERLAHLTWREKLGYGAGDAGFNFYWALIGSFLPAFYTDTLGLTAATLAWLLLATKIIDAFTDPIMGAVADRTKTRMGKFRPYLIWGSVPMGVAAVLAFTAPDLTYQGKVVWAFVTYTAMMMCYTVLSTPYSSLSGVMTANVQERNVLISVRFIFAFSASFLIGKFTPDLIAYMGDSDPKKGWQMSVMLYAVLASIAFTITFASTKERVSPPAKQKTSPAQDINDLLHNQAWVVLFALALIIMITITLRQGSAYYYITYFAERPDLWGWYTGTQLLALGIGCLATPFLTRYFEKKKILIALMAIVGLLSLAFYWVPSEAIGLMFTFNILISLALGPKSPLTWSMYADAADYNEWKFGRRATAMTFSAATFSQKLGSAGGASAMFAILAYFGYQANVAQTGASLEGIKLLQTLAPGGFAILAVVATLFYNLDNKTLAKIQASQLKRGEQGSPS